MGWRRAELVFSLCIAPFILLISHLNICIVCHADHALIPRAWRPSILLFSLIFMCSLDEFYLINIKDTLTKQLLRKVFT